MKYVRTVSEWTWRHALLGPAYIIDGLIQTVTLGFVSPTFGVRASLWIIKAQFKRYE